MLDFNAQGIIANKHKRNIKDIDLLFQKIHLGTDILPVKC